MIEQPNQSPRDEESVTALAGTVKLHQRHLIVCTGHQEWPAHIESNGGYFQKLAAAIQNATGAAAQLIKITASDEPSLRPEGSGYDILVYPNAVRLIDVRPDSFGPLVRSFLTLDEIPKSFEQENILSHYILVCCHGARDARCGQCGPPLVERFTEELSDQKIALDVKVQRVSHIGGHAYAGNVILYPGGHWYGLVQTGDIPQILSEHVLKGRIIQRLWRGRMGMSPEEQVTAAAHWLAE